MMQLTILAKFRYGMLSMHAIFPTWDNIRGRMFNYIIEVNSMLYKDNNNNNMEVLRIIIYVKERS